MRLDRVTLVSFSPTGTTLRVLTAIAEGLGGAVTHLDLTLPGAGTASHVTEGDLVLLGAPVYAGRVPATAAARFRQLSGQGTPAVLVVVYGNRAFEDALLELADLAEGAGFVPVAGAAFIGEHSYATAETPIAMGRPDAADLQQAVAFGRELRARFGTAWRAPQASELQLPGNRPHRRGYQPSGVAPITDPENCTLCGRCAEVCPVGAIAVGDAVVTDGSACVLCCACTRACPTGARQMTDQGVRDTARWLYANHATPKMPEIFW